MPQQEQLNHSNHKQGLGDSIHTALATVGITPSLVEQWLGRPCGCEERRQKLNLLGAWAKRVVSGKIDKAKQLIHSILEE
jgi:hypothetical protein